MQLTPRYGERPVLELHVEPGAVATAAARQRRRLVDVLAALSSDDWPRDTRCEGWDVSDVVNHLHSTNAFWSASIRGGLSGRPTTFLETFDPVATPAALAAADRSLGPDEVLDRFRRSTEDLVDVIEGLRGEQWRMLAEGPAGHIAIDAVVHHALWDSWVHERDILLPLGASQELEPDEVAAALRFAVALGPTFDANRGDANRGDANRGQTRPGTLTVRATRPDISLVVEAGTVVHVRHDEHAAEGDLHLAGDAVELVDVLSVRRPLPVDVADHPSAWLVGGLRIQFDHSG